MALPTDISGVDSIGAPRRPLPVKGNPDRRRNQHRTPDEEARKRTKRRSVQTPGEADQHEGGIDELV